MWNKCQHGTQRQFPLLEVFSSQYLFIISNFYKYLKFPLLFSAIIIQFWFFLLSFCFVGFGFCCRDFVSSMHAVFGKECCLFLLFWFSLLSFCSMHALCVSHGLLFQYACLVTHACFLVVLLICCSQMFSALFVVFQ